MLLFRVLLWFFLPLALLLLTSFSLYLRGRASFAGLPCCCVARELLALTFRVIANFLVAPFWLASCSCPSPSFGLLSLHRFCFCAVETLLPLVSPLWLPLWRLLFSPEGLSPFLPILCHSGIAHFRTVLLRSPRTVGWHRLLSSSPRRVGTRSSLALPRPLGSRCPVFHVALLLHPRSWGAIFPRFVLARFSLLVSSFALPS